MEENRKLNRWKIAFWICLTLLILTGVFSAYAVVDQGVSLTYLQESHQDTEADLQTLVELINETDLTKDEIQAELQNHRLREHMNFESNTVSLERVHLVFKNDRLEKLEID